MKLLEDRILQDGQVRPGNVLKVDCFLNHQLDVDLLDKIGEEFYRIFKNDGVNKILTIEASGIAIACMTARHFQRAGRVRQKGQEQEHRRRSLYLQGAVLYLWP